MFIDFGAGYDFKLIRDRFIHKPLPKDNGIVGIDRRPDNPEYYKDFFNLMDKYYVKVDNMWIKKRNTPFQFYDCYICADIRDNIDILDPADTWICISTLEHVPEEEVKSFLEGIISKIKPNSVGHIHIDLTDHRKYPPDIENCFLHYTDETWGTSLETDYRGLFLNRIRRNEWFEILDEYFTYKRGVNDGLTSVSLDEVRLKNNS